MDKEQAIDLLDNLIGMIEDNQGNDYDTAFRMAIEALKAQLSQEDTTFDTISRQAAIDAAKDWYEGLICGSINGLIKRLNALPTIQPEPQWIPCSERMPEPRIDVWVNSDLGQMVGYYDEMVELWYGRDYLELIVNAWMPLPEPYRKGESNEKSKSD